MLSQYNMNQMVHMDIDKSNKLLITPYNMISDNVFYCPETGSAYTVDHIEKAVKSTSGSAPSNPALNSLRSQISAAMKTYISKSYKADKCLSGVFVNGSDIIICVSAINTNLGAYWTGNWRATYKIPTNSGRVKLDATLEANVHYFEDGNVQLNASYKPTDADAVQYDTSSAEAIVNAISRTESEWQGNLEQMYIRMHEETFKRMRRMLPIRGTPMDWTPAAHSIQAEMGAGPK